MTEKGIQILARLKLVLTSFDLPFVRNFDIFGRFHGERIVYTKDQIKSGSNFNNTVGYKGNLI